MHPRIKFVFALTAAAFAGLQAGAYLFSDTQPRSYLAVGRCDRTCSGANDLRGMLTSVGIQRVPKGVPLVVKESDQCIAIRHPYSPQRLHFVFFPKRDIFNIGEIASGDEPYVMGCLAMLGELAREHKMTSYRVYSNGPVEQDITYLHFHLVSGD